MEEKRGASHIEMVFSFILFVSFVLFLLVYIRPYKTQGLTDSIILGLHDSFEKYTEINLTKIFIKKNCSVNCFDINIRGLNGVGGSLVKTAIDGEKVNSSFSNGILSIESDEDSFYVFISEEFEDSSISCNPTQLDESNYTIGSVDKKIVISNKKLLELKREYEDNYDSLKEKFGIPQSLDFGIRSENYVLEKLIPRNAEVVSRVYTHPVLFENGSLVNKRFIFKIW